jgi:peptide methionine sulfoxide reductase msrA/msrB
MKSVFSLIATLLITMTITTAKAAPTSVPTTSESIVVGMGCFWGAEKRMGEQPGVLSTEAGYAGGSNPSPTYESVLADAHSGNPNTHVEVVKVVFDPKITTLEHILIAFWQNHDPTQGNRQGNDQGANYRSVILYTTPAQRAIAEKTKQIYQNALHHAGYGPITTQIEPLGQFYPAENYHQHYLQKHPSGYCGTGGTGVAYPGVSALAPTTALPLDGSKLSSTQLIVFEGKGCQFCKQFDHDILSQWHAALPIASTFSSQAPTGWQLNSPLWATPTTVMFENGKEVGRYTGYTGNPHAFWTWLGQYLLSPAQQRVAFKAGTEQPYTGSLLDNHEPGTYVDPISGAALFRSDAKFESHSGWPSFFSPVPGAITLHEDNSGGMHRVEVLSTSSGIHLGHVFDDGPAPTGKRYCINSAVLRFVPDK